MKKDTLAIVIVILIILYFINKKRVVIDSISFSDEDVSGVTLKKGLYKISKINLQPGSTVNGFSLIQTGNTTTLTFASGKKKVFQKLSYYVTNKINPAE